jgi:hypothetical protein
MNGSEAQVKNSEKVQMTVRLRPDVYRRAKEHERRTGLPVSVVIANAAAASLLPIGEESAETRIHELAKRLLSRIEKLEGTLGRELFGTRELVAQFIRAYFNHTPALPEPERDAASLDGRLRFSRLVEQVNLNVRAGVSIIDEAKVQDAT